MSRLERQNFWETSSVDMSSWDLSLCSNGVKAANREKCMSYQIDR